MNQYYMDPIEKSARIVSSQLFSLVCWDGRKHQRTILLCQESRVAFSSILIVYLFSVYSRIRNGIGREKATEVGVYEAKRQRPTEEGIGQEEKVTPADRFVDQN
jgi:hypothetical protein